MRRIMIYLSILTLLIIAVMIISCCDQPQVKINVNIKIETTAFTWREGKQPYDIYGAIKHKLKKAGFSVVSDVSSDYDAILYVNYKEQKGSEYHYLGGSDTYYGTHITCDIRVDIKQDGEMKTLIYDYKISASTSSYVSERIEQQFSCSSPRDKLYSDALKNFKFQPEFENLGENIARSFGVELP